MSYATLVQPSARSQARAVLAIARKDLLHFYRYPLNALFRVIEPIVWLTPVYFLGRSFAPGLNSAGFAAYAGTGDYVSFILVGTILANFIQSVFFGIGFALKTEMDEGVLESNWLAPLPRPLFLAGQTVANMLITTINSAAMLLIGSLLFGLHLGGNLLPAVLVLACTLVALYGFGFAFAALVLLLKDANTLVDVSQFLVVQLSGTEFPVRVLPRLLLPVSLALPLTYGYDAIRTFLLGTDPLLPVLYEIAIVVVFMLVMTVLGNAVFLQVDRYVRRRGTLATH